MHEVVLRKYAHFPIVRNKDILFRNQYRRMPCHMHRRTQHEARGALVFYISVNWNHISSCQANHLLPLQLVFWKHTVCSALVEEAQYAANRWSAKKLMTTSNRQNSTNGNHGHKMLELSNGKILSELTFIIIRLTNGVGTWLLRRSKTRVIFLLKWLRVELLEWSYRCLHWHAVSDSFSLCDCISNEPSGRGRIKKVWPASFVSPPGTSLRCCLNVSMLECDQTPGVAAALAEMVATWCSRRAALRLQLAARLPFACTCSHLPGEKCEQVWENLPPAMKRLIAASDS